METDVHQALKEAENSLRDFITRVLEKKLGMDWIEKCGVPSSRIKSWRKLRAAEAERQQTGVGKEGLLYYAELSDLKTILEKQWCGELADALGDLGTMQVFLDELRTLRNPHAHHRELLPHQKHLVLGISGEIRNRLVRYRSKMETSEDYYPRLEGVRDNLGTVWVAEGDYYGTIVPTGNYLRPGDTVQFVVSATDPLGQPLSYGIKLIHHVSGGIHWQDDNVLSVTITKADVGRMCDANIYVRSPREYHAMDDFDDINTFRYEVLPPK